jgi:hypothetical protein
MLLGASWLFLAVALGVTLRAPVWQDCAGDPLPRSELVGLLCLVLAAISLMGLLSWLLAGALRPVRPLLVAGALCLLSGGALALIAVFFWHHSVSCSGG